MIQKKAIQPTRWSRARVDPRRRQERPASPRPGQNTQRRRRSPSIPAQQGTSASGSARAVDEVRPNARPRRLNHTSEPQQPRENSAYALPVDQAAATSRRKRQKNSSPAAAALVPHEEDALFLPGTRSRGPSVKLDERLVVVAAPTARRRRQAPQRWSPKRTGGRPTAQVDRTAPPRRLAGVASSGRREDLATTRSPVPSSSKSRNWS